MNKARRFVIETPLGKLEVYAKHDKSDCAEDYPGVFIDFVREDGATCWLVWSMIRTKICSRQSSMAIAHRTSQQRLLNTTTLILKNEEDRLCLIGRLELLR